MTLKCQCHRSKQMAPSDSLASKTYIQVPKSLSCALVQQLWSKTSFRIMVSNVTHLCMSHTETAQDIFKLLKGPNPSHLVLNGNILLVNK